MFSFGQWKSWKRCQGSVLQGYLKKKIFAVLFKFDGEFYVIEAKKKEQ